MSTSFLEVIAADQSNQHLADRQAAIAAERRIAGTLGKFITASSSKDEVCARLSLVDDEILTIVSRACEEYGSSAHEAINEAIRLTAVSRFDTNTVKTASIHESRRPKMCPFHKDVVDISLTSEDPRAGFDSMAQHWGGPRHCEGDGYEGSKCNFKPQMATQTYWDEKAEKAEERKRDRAEQAELEQDQDFVTEDVEAEEFDTTSEDFDEQVEQDINSLTDDGISDDNVVEVDFGGGDESVVEEPMEVAAKKQGGAHKQADLMGFDDEEDDRTRKPCPACDKKGEVNGKICQRCDGDGELWLKPDKAASTKTADFDQNKFNLDELIDQIDEHLATDIGDEERERYQKHLDALMKLKKESSLRVADKGNTDLDGPSPKMDKKKWSPQNVTEIKADDEDGPHPTERKDIIDSQRPTNGGDRFNPGTLSEIGEGVTERQDITKDTNPSDQGAHTKTWSGGGQSAVTSAKADDVYKNPLKELLESDYDGFIPQEVVQSAIASYKQ
jgi:hypothetical protein